MRFTAISSVVQYALRSNKKIEKGLYCPESNHEEFATGESDGSVDNFHEAKV